MINNNNIYIIPATNQQLVRLSVSDVILYDWFSTTTAIFLKHSTTKECVLCVCMLDREGRTLGVSSTAVVLDNIYIFVVWTAVCQIQ